MDKIPGKNKETSENVKELKAMFKSEPIASLFKMELLELSPGYAKIGMKLLAEYQNFNGMIFGGILMALADQAFAYGSNSLIRPSLASQFNIHFIAAPEVGDKLIAECHVIRSGHRVGVSEMTVFNQKGKLIAKATGTTIPVTKSPES